MGSLVFPTAGVVAGIAAGIATSLWVRSRPHLRRKQPSTLVILLAGGSVTFLAASRYAIHATMFGFIGGFLAVGLVIALWGRRPAPR